MSTLHYLKKFETLSLGKNIIEQTANTAAGNDNPVDEKIIQAYRHYHNSLISAEVVIPVASDIAAFVSRNRTLTLLVSSRW